MKKKDLIRFVEQLSLNECNEVVPNGWFTSKELEKETGYSNSTLIKKLNVLIKAKKVHRKNFRIKLLSCSKPVPHYKFVGKSIKI